MNFILVIAIKALGEISEVFTKKNVTTNMSVQFNIDGFIAQTFTIQNWNATAVQQKLLSKIPDRVSLNAQGKGMGYAAVSCEYFIKAKNAGENFELIVRGELSEADEIVTIHIKTRASPTNADADVTGMSLVEVELPSGFKFREEEAMFYDLAPLGIKVRKFKT